MSRREAAISVATTAGGLVMGVLKGVVVAVGLSLFWILATALRPGDAVLGSLPGLGGFHSIRDFPEARTLPGLLLYRFDGDILFFNVDYLRDRLRRRIRRASAPVRWVVVDLAPVSQIDATALQRFDELREELARDGITLAVARGRQQLARSFAPAFAAARAEARPTRNFPTLRAAVAAFEAEGAAAGADRG